jgi:hypothetical protein
VNNTPRWQRRRPRPQACAACRPCRPWTRAAPSGRDPESSPGHCGCSKRSEDESQNASCSGTQRQCVEEHCIANCNSQDSSQQGEWVKAPNGITAQTQHRHRRGEKQSSLTTPACAPDGTTVAAGAETATSGVEGDTADNNGPRDHTVQGKQRRVELRDCTQTAGFQTMDRTQTAGNSSRRRAQEANGTWVAHGESRSELGLHSGETQPRKNQAGQKHRRSEACRAANKATATAAHPEQAITGSTSTLP